MIDFIRIIFLGALLACAACGKFGGSSDEPRQVGQNCKINPAQFKLFFKEDIQEDIACLELNFRDYYVKSVKRENHAYVTYEDVQKFIEKFYDEIDPQLPEAFRLIFKLNGFFFNNVSDVQAANAETSPERLNQKLYLNNITAVFRIITAINHTAAQIYPILTGPPPANLVEYQLKKALWQEAWQGLGESLNAILPPLPQTAEASFVHNVLDLAQIWQTVGTYWASPSAETSASQDTAATSASSTLAIDLFYSLKVHLLGGEATQLTYPEAYLLLQHCTDWPALFFDLLYGRPNIFAHPQDYFALLEHHFVHLMTTATPARGAGFNLQDDLWPWFGLLLRQIIPSLSDATIKDFTARITARLKQRFPDLVIAGNLPESFKKYFQGQFLYLLILEYFGHWQLAHQDVFFPRPSSLENFWEFDPDVLDISQDTALRQQEELLADWQAQQAALLPEQLLATLTDEAGMAKLDPTYLTAQLNQLLAQHQYDGRRDKFSWQKRIPLTAANLSMSIFYHWAAQFLLDFYQGILQTEEAFSLTVTNHASDADFGLTPQRMQPIFEDLWPIINTFNLPNKQDQQGLILAIFYVGDLLLLDSDGSGAITTPELAQLWPFIYAATNLGKMLWEHLPPFCPAHQEETAPSMAEASDSLARDNDAAPITYDRHCWHTHFLSLMMQLQTMDKIYLEGSADFWASLKKADTENSEHNTAAYLARLEKIMQINSANPELQFQEVLLTSAALLATESFFLRFDNAEENDHRDQLLQHQELDRIFTLVCPTIKSNVLPDQDFDEKYARSIFDYVLEKRCLPLSTWGKANIYWYHWFSRHDLPQLTRFDFLDLAIMLKRDPEVMTIVKKNKFGQPKMDQGQGFIKKSINLVAEYIKELALGAKDKDEDKD